MGKLYEKCAACKGTRKTLAEAMVDGPTFRGRLKAGSACPCCGDGYVETGLTAGQVERIRADRDRLLVALADLEAADGPAVALRLVEVRGLLAGRAGEVAVAVAVARRTSG